MQFIILKIECTDRSQTTKFDVEDREGRKKQTARYQETSPLNKLHPQKIIAPAVIHCATASRTTSKYRDRHKLFECMRLSRGSRILLSQMLSPANEDVSPKSISPMTNEDASPNLSPANEDASPKSSPANKDTSLNISPANEDVPPNEIEKTTINNVIEQQEQGPASFEFENFLSLMEDEADCPNSNLKRGTAMNENNDLKEERKARARSNKESHDSVSILESKSRKTDQTNSELHDELESCKDGDAKKNHADSMLLENRIKRCSFLEQGNKNKDGIMPSLQNQIKEL